MLWRWIKLHTHLQIWFWHFFRYYMKGDIEFAHRESTLIANPAAVPLLILNGYIIVPFFSLILSKNLLNCNIIEFGSYTQIFRGCLVWGGIYIHNILISNLIRRYSYNYPAYSLFFSWKWVKRIKIWVCVKVFSVLRTVELWYTR